jgi:hypothetical protein
MKRRSWQALASIGCDEFQVPHRPPDAGADLDGRIARHRDEYLTAKILQPI